MVLGRKVSIMMSVGLALVLLGCGSGSSDNDTENQTGTPAADNNTSDNDTSGGGDDTNNTVVAGYTSSTGVLIETKSDGTKLAWVNTTGTACLIYRIANEGGTIVGGGTAHCEGLDYGGITTWRMPTEAEAVYFMENAPLNPSGERNIDAQYLIYPDNNPTCLFMATSTSDRYVYTTNHTSTGAFTDAARGTAGIRCVADQ